MTARDERVNQMRSDKTGAASNQDTEFVISSFLRFYTLRVPLPDSFSILSLIFDAIAFEADRLAVAIPDRQTWCLPRICESGA